ncbi:Ig lambda-2 chain C region [Podarcis lilfordi]|uniref:Ig lambda-2 chain C region n=1 Tax=Podarcis lilfordi TaxID=74358 RepID=A0AA35JQP0_9SAUR|nr:Ig lambda-2 chain C region [Podarcis lilfordi]
MAAGLPQSRCGLFQHLLFSLWALQGGLVTSNPGVKVTQHPSVVSKRQGLVTSTSGVEVTQHPPLANKWQGETLELSCDVHQNTYHYYCAAPKDASPSESKEGRRARKEPSRRAGSSREDFARGAREAAVLCEQAYFADTGTQLIVEDENCQRSQPTVHLLGPVCHKDHVTLVCVAQGFPYEWPIDVSWKRDAQEVTHLSFATDPVRTLNGTCNFGVSSRLSMTAAEWQERHVYSCHVRQGNITEAEESMEREPSQQPASTVLEFQSSLHTGQLIFLLLVVKSFAYGTALGIYTACKKKTGL